MRRKVSGLVPSAAGLLLRYEWPGNIRELKNAMERAVALAHRTRVENEDLPEEIRQTPPRPVATLGTVQSLAESEKNYILSVLELNGGNQPRAAKQLRIGSARLYRKLKSYAFINGTGRDDRRAKRKESPWKN